MWQNITSWTEGLFSEITNSNSSLSNGVFATFERKPATWSKQGLLGISTKFTTNPFRNLFGGSPYIVAINTGVKSIKSSVDVKTRDNAPGKIQVAIQYQVHDPNALFDVEDPLLGLVDYVKDLLRYYVGEKEVLSINEMDIVKQFNKDIIKKNKTMHGLAVRYLGVEITWAEHISKRFEETALDNLQKFKNQRKIQNFIDLGVTDSKALYTVLCMSDPDADELEKRLRSDAESKIQEKINERNYSKEILSLAISQNLAIPEQFQDLIEAAVKNMSEPLPSVSDLKPEESVNIEKMSTLDKKKQEQLENSRSSSFTKKGEITDGKQK